ncbi:MAG: DUF3500 domain-containing protein [Planctomycetes bacterium]|nr:DUF3500 domain-containing protein [Planctomycetota bacterium]
MRPAGFCPDCDDVNRRDFLKATAAGVAGVSALSVPASALLAGQPKKDTPRRKSETLVAQFYQTLSDEQKQKMAFPFDHELRSAVDNNWHITKVRLGKDFTGEQQELVREIFLGLHSPEYADKVLAQVAHDSDSKGLEDAAVAVFGTPGTGKFEFVLTGRHVTRRCDGDSVAGAAFGGPIFYGHAAQGFNEKPDHPGNIYWYQAVQANKLFDALDGKQRELALRTDARDEQGTDTVKLGGEPQGIPVAELSSDQKQLVRETMADVLAPFRKADADECLKLVEAGGFDKLHMAFFKNMDVGNDGVWDVWQIQGPAMLWYFRGDPHVHTWVHIREPKQA